LKSKKDFVSISRHGFSFLSALGFIEMIHRILGGVFGHHG